MKWVNFSNILDLNITTATLLINFHSHFTYIFDLVLHSLCDPVCSDSDIQIADYQQLDKVVQKGRKQQGYGGKRG